MGRPSRPSPKSSNSSGVNVSKLLLLLLLSSSSSKSCSESSFCNSVCINKDTPYLLAMRLDPHFPASRVGLLSGFETICVVFEATSVAEQHCARVGGNLMAVSRFQHGRILSLANRKGEPSLAQVRAWRSLLGWHLPIRFPCNEINAWPTGQFLSCKRRSLFTVNYR